MDGENNNGMDKGREKEGRDETGVIMRKER